MEKQNLLKTPDAAIYLSTRGFPVTTKTLEVWRCYGKGPKYIKLTRRVFYRPEHLDEFLKGIEIKTIDPALQNVRPRKVAVHVPVHD